MSMRGNDDKSKKSIRKIRKRDTILKNALRSFKHAVWSVEQTDFHPDFVRMYEEAKELGKLTNAMIVRTKAMIQPNPSWQKDTLPPAEEWTNLDLFVSCLVDSGKQLKTKMPQISTFYEKSAASIAECGKAYTQFLVSVKVNTLKPLDTYVNEDLPKIRTEYYTLHRYKKIYDERRNKLKTCTPDKIESMAHDLNEMKEEFEKQANLGM